MNNFQQFIFLVAKRIEKFTLWTGHIISWLTLFMVLLVFLVVILRYLFNSGSIQMQESITYLHGMVFLLAAGFTLQQDEHVRVDVFYDRLCHKKRSLIDLSGTILLLFPVCIYIFSMSLDFVILSWKINEASGEAGGLPGLYLLKSLILIMPLLMMLQGLAWIIRHTLFLTGKIDSPYKKHNEAGI